eukprot:14110277-Alexandrium_andersonii.AAC.1
MPNRSIRCATRPDRYSLSVSLDLASSNEASMCHGFHICQRRLQMLFAIPARMLRRMQIMSA